MSRFAIEVTLTIAKGRSCEFEPLIHANARATLADEPACHDFRVFRDVEDEHTFVLFEVYSDAEALEEHRRTTHYRAFAEAAAELIVRKEVRSLWELRE